MPRFRFKTPVFSRLCGFCQLFPLDGARGFAGDVVDYAVDAGDFGGDAPGDVLQKGEGHILHGGGHGVPGVDGPDDHRPVVGALVVLHAGGLEIGYHGEIILVINHDNKMITRAF